MDRNNGPVLVGLCGRSGSGKGYVSRLFAEIGIPAIDTDGVYRKMTAPCEKEELSQCMKELAAFFGDGIRNEDNSLNRAALRGLVFGEENKKNLLKLNEITHRHILFETEREADRLYREGYDIILIDAPVLFESGFDRFCSAVICVTASHELSVQRIMERDGLDRKSAELRLSSQISVEELLEKAQYVIENDTAKDVLVRRVKEVADSLKAQYGENKWD